MKQHNKIYKSNCHRKDMNKIRWDKKMCGKENKKAQLTIFIILAIVLVAVLVIIFYPKISVIIKPTVMPNEYISECIEGKVDDTKTTISLQGGSLAPGNYIMYQGNKIEYLCYTNEFYITCTIQKPFLVQHFEEGISKSLRDEINACYLASINDLKERGYEVVSGEVNYEVSLEPSVARVLIDAPTTVGANKFARFNVKLNSPIYDMIMISTSILQFESELGDSDVTSLMFLHPEVIIDKLKQGDGTTIYIVTSKDYGIEFKFASRSLAWPAGYDI